MGESRFETPAGVHVPSVTADEMREIDRFTVDRVGLSVLQMMENAGRNLAVHGRQLGDDCPITILAGAGGNGGGGLACARHLANRDVPITVVVDRDPCEFSGPTETQFEILDAVDLLVTTDDAAVDSADLIVDALIGYGLRDEPRGRAAELIDRCDRASAPILSLDVPSGWNATTGSTPGAAISPARTLTLALPKTGLSDIPGELFLGDIGIPGAVFRRFEISYENPYRDEYWVSLRS